MRKIFFGRISGLTYAAISFGLSCLYLPSFIFIWPITVSLFVLTLIGLKDITQTKSNLLSNYPLIGRMRFMFESIRPEIRQYFLESDTEEIPYSREQRAMVYRRAKGQTAMEPFGTIKNVYDKNFNWLNHSIQPSHIADKNFRTVVGNSKVQYNASLLNISGTSFGALSPTAIEALNLGAQQGNFAHNTGEGSISPFHNAHSGDLIWQISTGYFGCRNLNGSFDPKKFSEKALQDNVKMIEIKISQGAKPGHGGILLASKVTEEIALTRGVQERKDCISPNKHSAFSTPFELLEFASTLRELSGGKPIGIKLCIGHPWEFISIVKAMVQSKKMLDFITIDGSEGGTGAAPNEFLDNVGWPLRDALVLADNTLTGAGIRQKVKVAASGKIVSAYDIIRHCALGADWCNMARPFMFTLGCIQARNCASGHCPTGIATMDRSRYKAVDVENRAVRVAAFHKNTLDAVAELLEAAGLNHPSQLTRKYISRRVSANEIKFADDVYPKMKENALITGEPIPDFWIKEYWDKVDGNSFQLMD